jgi:hypothetical protein
VSASLKTRVTVPAGALLLIAKRAGAAARFGKAGFAGRRQVSVPAETMLSFRFSAPVALDG